MPSDQKRVAFDIRWSSTWNSERWISLKALSGGSENVYPPPPDDVEVLSFGPVFDENDQIVTLIAIHPRDADKCDWVMHVDGRPRGDVPSEILDAANKMGGLDGLSRVILSTQENNLPPTGVYSIRVTLVESDWTCRVMPRPVAPDSPVARLDLKARLEQVGYRLPDGPLGLAEFVIVYDHEHQRFQVRIRAHGIVKVGEGFEYVQQVATLVTGAMFEQVPHA
jgi:hypothetical protein